jgi:hypothetical protein
VAILNDRFTHDMVAMRRNVNRFMNFKMPLRIRSSQARTETEKRRKKTGHVTGCCVADCVLSQLRYDFTTFSPVFSSKSTSLSASEGVFVLVIMTLTTIGYVSLYGLD